MNELVRSKYPSNVKPLEQNYFTVLLPTEAKILSKQDLFFVKLDATVQIHKLLRKILERHQVCSLCARYSETVTVRDDRGSKN